MLAIDSEKAERLRAEAQADRARQAQADWIQRQLGNAIEVDLRGTPLNPERQMGQPLRHEVFERRLKKLLAPQRILFGQHPLNSTKRWLKIPLGEGAFTVPYEAGLLPEFSICTVRERWVPDPDFSPRAGGKAPLKRFERADLKGGDRALSKQEVFDLLKARGFQGALAELRKREANPDRVGFKKVLEKSGEALRGWRTVLAHLVAAGFLTPEQCERAFGGSERAGWAAEVGHKTANPW